MIAEGRDPQVAERPWHAGHHAVQGLGEMMPKVLCETTLSPRTRRLLRVEVTDQIVTDRVIDV
jgi:DNA gyrase/topoisomerase IV subunit B